MNSDRAAEILEKAADLLESGNMGWSQNRRYLTCTRDGGTKGCAMGAVYMAADCAELRQYEDGRFSWVLNFRGGKILDVDLAELLLKQKVQTATVEEWNDHKDRTLGEVVDLLKGVAKDARNEVTQ